VCRQKDEVMSDKQLFEISGWVDCQFRLAVHATDAAEAAELFDEFLESGVDFVEFIDWIDDFSVTTITPADLANPVKVVTVNRERLQ
jgi:hypothetical protein